MKRLMTTTPGAPNTAFAQLAGDERVDSTMKGLEARGARTFVVANGAEAKDKVLGLLPDGAEVFTSTSTTLDVIGLSAAINESPRFDAVHPRVLRMNRQTEARAIRKLRAGPDFIVGSVHAITEDGQLMIASASGSQLGPYAWTAGSVIWVAGTQKIVADLDEGMRRIEEYCYPLEDPRSRRVYGAPSTIGKVLIVNHEGHAGRLTMILVREVLGF